MDQQVAAALSEAAEWMISQRSVDEIETLIEADTPMLAGQLSDVCLQTLGAAFDAAAFRASVMSAPYLLLQGAFKVDDLPDTPTDFLPVPRCKTTLRARLAALALHALLDEKTIAYRSENQGGLFVNLVAMPGKGTIPNKSTSGMRGHTDACSFPFPGTRDPDNPNIAPSPDLVTLLGLRNPEPVPTHVIPVDNALARLSPQDIEELLKPQFNIECQGTFRKGTEEILGDPHIAVDAEVLRAVGQEYWVRFSHSKVKPDEGNTAAIESRENFAAACKEEQIYLDLAPGSLLLINNRRALHGRSEPKKEFGGKTRWLLRTYALDSQSIQPENCYPDGYQLYP